MNVRITRVDPSLPLPSYQTSGAVAFDLAIREGSIIAPGTTSLVPANVIIGVPAGYALVLAARSSLHKRGLILANGIGVIDEDYCGPDDEIRLALYNATDASVRVERGDRLAQALFVPVERAVFEELALTEIRAENRGGFGSTGRS